MSKDDVELTWKKNGQEIKPDGKKYEVVRDGTVHRLVIHDIQLDDDAEYQCSFGDDVSTCKLHVEGNNPVDIYFSIFNMIIEMQYLLIILIVKTSSCVGLCVRCSIVLAIRVF